MLSAQADATIQAEFPDSNFGSSVILSVAGTTTNQVTPVQKAYLRFDLNGLPDLITARLDLTVIEARDLGNSYFQWVELLLDESSDGWNENTIHWNNAPPKQPRRHRLPGSPDDPWIIFCPKPSCGRRYLFHLPKCRAAQHRSRCQQPRDSWHRQHLWLPCYQNHGLRRPRAPRLCPPTLEITHSPLQPNRPLFFTTAPGAASGIDLQWLDNSTDETGFEIERRPLGAAPFAPLQTLGPDATAFTDATPLPGIVYEYRVRATETPANSTWSFTATTAAPGMETPYQAWLQSVGLPMDGSGAGAPLAAPAGDNIANLTKYGLGLDPAIGGYEGRFASDVLLDGGLEYFRLTYVRPEPPPSGVAYRVEASPDLIGWTSFGITSISTRLGG